MKLTKDNARLLRGVPEQPGDPAHLEHVETVEEANAVMFECPLGHGHGVLVYFAPHGKAAPVHPDWRPKPRWNVTGKDLSDITISPSINLNVPYVGCSECMAEKNPCPTHPKAPRKTWPPGCTWHGFVVKGEAK